MAEDGDHLTVEITAPGAPFPAWLVADLEDRAGAVGGRVHASGSTIRAEVPL